MRQGGPSLYVCFCEAVTASALYAAVEAGACDLVAVADECGAGTACGRCRPALQKILTARAS